jgi:hypothetical protein
MRKSVSFKSNREEDDESVDIESKLRQLLHQQSGLADNTFGASPNDIEI